MIPQKYRDFSEESLKNNGYNLRSYVTLLEYAAVIRNVLRPADAADPLRQAVTFYASFDAEAKDGERAC